MRDRKKREATHPVQHERYRYERNGQEPQRRTRPRDPQILIHCRREQREPGAETAPHEIVPRQHASRVLRVRIWEVVEDGVEEEEGAEREEAGADDGHDPVDAGACGPAEPEEADGDTECADESGREAFFGFEFAVLVELGFHHLVEVVEERWDDEDCAD